MAELFFFQLFTCAVAVVEKLSAILGVLSGVSQTVLSGNNQRTSVWKTREG